MNERQDPKVIDKAVRASDSERERIAKMVSEAAGEGRLSIAEADERLNLIYATTFRHELAEYVSDLPEGAKDAPPPRTRAERFPTRLRVHLGIAVALTVMLMVRWVASDVPYFWPGPPMFLLWGSFLVHARVIRRGGAPWARQPQSPPWWVERRHEYVGR
jgi:hypothetical protein